MSDFKTLFYILRIFMMAAQSDETLDAIIYRKLAQFCLAISGDSIDPEKNLIITKQIFEEKPEVLDKILSTNNFSDFKFSEFSILDVAMKMDALEVFNYLIERGANVTAKNDQNNTVVHEAMQRGKFNYRKHSCELYGRLENFYAHLVLIEQMKSNKLENMHNNYGMSHFHVACMINDAAVVKSFLDHGQAVNEAIDVGSIELPGYTPLHLAARYCAFETIVILLEYGADVHLTDAKGISPLHLLLQWSMMIIDNMNMGKRAPYDEFMRDLAINKTMIKVIFEKNSRFHRIGLTSFHIACTMQDTEAVERLLQKNVNLYCCVRINANLWPGYTGLHFAAHFNFDTLRLLLNYGVNIFIEDAKGITPFDLCLQRYGAEQIYLLIVSQSTWTEIQFVDKQTKLLDLVFAMQDQRTFTVFLSNMPNINTSIPLDSPLWPGCTPLHLAVIFAKRTKDINDLYQQTDYNPENSLATSYNCSEEEENLYMERITVLLNLDSDVTTQDAFGSTPVHLAYRLGRVNVAKLLLQYHWKSVNPIDRGGLSHLHVACAAGKSNLVDKLLFGGADVNSSIFPRPTNSTISTNDIRRPIPNHSLAIPLGSTPLHIAIEVKDNELIELLVKRGADLYAKDVDGLTPIHKILMTESLVKTEEFSTLFENLKNITVSGFTSLNMAAFLNNVNAVGRFLDFGVDIEAAVGRGSTDDSKPSEIADSAEMLPEQLKEFKGYRALHFAVKRRSREMVELLWIHGANILAKSDDGSVPLYMSLKDGFNNHTDELFVEILKHHDSLQKKVQVDTGVTMLHIACHLANVQLAEESLARGIDVNATTLKNSPLWPNATPLHVASKHTIDLLQVLLNNGADVTIKDNEGITPILEHHNDLYLEWTDAAMKLLLAAHCDYNVNPCFENVTHFHVACARNAVTQVEGFLNHGVDINFPVDYYSDFEGGITPLHCALKYGSMDTFNLLMRHSVNVRVHDVHGNTPLHFAFDLPVLNLTVLNKLISAGADVNAPNIYGETPFELLLNGHSTKESIELFLRHADHVNVFNPVSDVGLIGLAFNLENRLVNANVLNQMELMELFINSPHLLEVDDKGRNALHNIVSDNRPNLPPETQYIDIIDRLVRLGCDIDAKDYLGRTPLHLAVQFQNCEGIVGLLECGANMDLLDGSGRTVFAYNFNCFGESDQNYHIINLLFMTNVNMRKFVGLQSTRQNKMIFAKVLEIFNLTQISEDGYQEHVDKLKLETIGSSSVTLYDFLSETGAVTAYPHMRQPERQAIDNFFENCKDQLRRKYPNWSALIWLQYRKAQMRLALVSPAKESIYYLTMAHLDEICYVVILRFLDNEELKNLITSTTYLEE